MDPAALARELRPDEGLEQRLGLRALATDHGAQAALRITYDGWIRTSGGTAEWLDGWIAVQYPSDTTWCRLEVEVEIVDLDGRPIVEPISLHREEHQGFVELVSGSEIRDVVEDTARGLAADVAEVLTSPP